MHIYPHPVIIFPTRFNCFRIRYLHFRCTMCQLYLHNKQCVTTHWKHDCFDFKQSAFIPHSLNTCKIGIYQEICKPFTCLIGGIWTHVHSRYDMLLSLLMRQTSGLIWDNKFVTRLVNRIICKTNNNELKTARHNLTLHLCFFPSVRSLSVSKTLYSHCLGCRPIVNFSL